jgi:cytochrome c biogenesis protein CcmG/thiol:disulfide interchange protein DsbE
VRGRLALAALVAGVLAAGCAGPAVDRVPPSTFRDSGFAACPAPASGAPAADSLSSTALQCMDGSGRSVSLDRPIGTPTVVNLWATWCAPCAEELPAFQRLHADAGNELVVLGVVTDSAATQSVAAAKDLDLRFANVYDRESTVLKGLRRASLPVTAFVGADGGVRHVYTGPALTDTELRDLVREHLGVVVR